MNVINAESRFQARDNEVYQAIVAGNTTADVAKQFRLTGANVRRICRRAKITKVISLALHDGTATIPVAQVATSKGFEHACKFAIRRFSGTFSRLELPQWSLIAPGHSINVRKLIQGAA